MASEKNITNLVINKVESKKVYDYMVTNNLINDDELYFVQDTETDFSVTQMTVTETVSNNNISYSCNKTYSTVLSEINNDSVTICKFVGSDSKPVITLLSTYDNSSIKFVGTDPSTSKQIVITLSSTDIVTVDRTSGSTGITLIDH